MQKTTGAPLVRFQAAPQRNPLSQAAHPSPLILQRLFNPSFNTRSYRLCSRTAPCTVSGTQIARSSPVRSNLTKGHGIPAVGLDPIAGAIRSHPRRNDIADVAQIPVHLEAIGDDRFAKRGAHIKQDVVSCILSRPRRIVGKIAQRRAAVGPVRSKN
jgi:hypothetical protein